MRGYSPLKIRLSKYSSCHRKLESDKSEKHDTLNKIVTYKKTIYAVNFQKEAQHLMAITLPVFLIVFFKPFSGFFKTLLMKTGSSYNRKNYSTEVNGETAQILSPSTVQSPLSRSAACGGQNTWALPHDLEEESHVVEDTIKKISLSFKYWSPAPAPRILEIAGGERGSR